MKLDRARPYETCISIDAPPSYVQDGIAYDHRGERIDVLPVMEPTFDAEAADRGLLVLKAEELGMQIDHRWGLRRLREAFRRA